MDWVALDFPSIDATPGLRLINSHLEKNFAGYDANADGVLDNPEATIRFQKTPKTNRDGSAYAPRPGTTGDPTFALLDRFIVVTLDDFTTARAAVDGYGGLPFSLTHTAAAELIQAFARGANTVPGASPTEFGVLLDASVIPSKDGLSHPVGGEWDAAKQTNTHRLVLPDGSALSNKVEGSDGLKTMWGRILWNKRSVLAAAAPSSWGAATLKVSDDDISFSESDAGKVVHAALGKCKFVGTLQVSLKAKAGGGFDVGALKYSGDVIDLYDFAYGTGNIGPIEVKNAARTQAGFATLTSTTHPNAGRVFYTKVQVSHDWFDYSGSY